jgi:anaerobic magnesium-protoporphyrin IX monomethyl ester cyclase
MHVALLFPPATDPRSPHLAIPSLAATLRAAGVRTTVRDLDVEGLLATIAPERVADAARVCAARLDRASDLAERDRLCAALAHADYVVGHIGAAPVTLRDPDQFYASHAYFAARQCIVQALELVAAAAGPVYYDVNPARYDVVGCDPARLADLAAVTADPRVNLFENYYQEQVLPDLERDRPDVVGLSILNLQQIIPGLRLARLLKERGHFVVLGGTVYTKVVPRLLERPAFFDLYCDGLVVYEGETALVALLDQLAGGRDLRRVPNMLSLDTHGRPVQGPYHAEDVNALPTPDFDGLPLDSYLAPRPVFPILTGKGCYFNRCKFCEIPFINRAAPKAYRVRRPELIAADVATLHRRYGVRHFEITDEALAPKLLLRLGEALEAYPEVRPRFVGYARLEPGFTPEVCQRLYGMGVRKLFFGLESGAQATLDHMDKGIRVENAATVLRNCADAGIAFHLFSIVGFPEEREESARQTVRFMLDHAALLDHPRNSFDIHPFTLDLHTDYGMHPEYYGIEIDAADLATRDFPLMVERWRNTRGLDQATVERLLGEFHAALYETFPTYRQFHGHLWPGYEEYAVLYAEHYEARPFAYRYTLPPPGAPGPFRLTWSESVRFDAVNGGYRIASLEGATTMPQVALLLLGEPPPPLPVDALLDMLAARLRPTPEQQPRVVAEVRKLVERLLGAGALRLEPADDAVPTVA